MIWTLLVIALVVLLVAWADRRQKRHPGNTTIDPYRDR